MNCPKCGCEISSSIFDPESWEVAAEFNHPQKCPECKLVITKKLIQENMLPSDCKKVQNEEIGEDEFNSYDDGFCIDCIEECIFAKGDISFDMVQDEEGNWVNPGDLDPDERERMQ